MTDDLDPRRHLEIEGSYNIRDLGGYATLNGRRTRWGRLLRSGSLHRLQDAAQEALLEYGLCTVIDLRTSKELQTRPNPFFSSEKVAYYHQNMEGDAGLRETENIPDALEVVERKRRTYLAILDECRSQVCATLSLLSLSETLPALFHCAAGRDRTGIIAALVLGICAVPAATIAEDYGLTARFLIDEHLEQNPEISADEFTWQEYQRRSCPPETMLGVLQALEERYDGVEGYVRDIGLSESQIESIREAMME